MSLYDQLLQNETIIIMNAEADLDLSLDYGKGWGVDP